MGNHIFGVMQRKHKEDTAWTTFGTDDLVEYRHTDMFAVLGFRRYQVDGITPIALERGFPDDYLHILPDYEPLQPNGQLAIAPLDEDGYPGHYWIGKFGLHWLTFEEVLCYDWTKVFPEPEECVDKFIALLHQTRLDNPQMDLRIVIGYE